MNQRTARTRLRSAALAIAALILASCAPQTAPVPPTSPASVPATPVVPAEHPLTGTVTGTDDEGTGGVPGITVALVSLSSVSLVAAGVTGACPGESCGQFNLLATAGSGDLADLAGPYSLLFLDNRGCGAANLGTTTFPGTPPAAGAPGCPTGAAGEETAGCVPPAVCGYQPSWLPITLDQSSDAQDVGTVTLDPAPIPTELGAPSATTDAAFGFVRNTIGNGVRGLTVTAIPLIGGSCGSGAAPITVPVAPACEAAAGNARAALPTPVTTQPTSGAWAITGLTPSLPYYFVLSGPGVNPDTTLTPSNAGGNGCSLVPVCTAGAPAGPAAGTQTLPPFIIGGGAASIMPGTQEPGGGGKWAHAGTFAINASDAP